MWGSSMDDMQEKGAGVEIDYYLGYGGNLTEDVSFDVSVATYTYPRTGWKMTWSTWVASVPTVPPSV